MNNIPGESLPKSVKEGDMFQIGGHVLACGKAEDSIVIRNLLAGRKINLVLTDPPYGANYVEEKSKFLQIVSKLNIINDHLQSEEEYFTFTKGWLKNIKEYIYLPNSIYIFNTDKMAFAVKRALEGEGGKFSQLLIWAKNNSVVGRLDYNPQHELIIYGWFGKHEFYKSKDKSVLCYPKPAKSKLHPTMKPVPLLRHLILNSSNMGEIVWDGFGGSGSTMIACEQTRRICIMTETSPLYCQIILERMHKIFPILEIKQLNL